MVTIMYNGMINRLLKLSQLMQCCKVANKIVINVFTVPKVHLGFHLGQIHCYAN